MGTGLSHHSDAHQPGGERKGETVQHGMILASHFFLLSSFSPSPFLPPSLPPTFSFSPPPPPILLLSPQLKCHKYWPDEGERARVFDAIRVHLQETLTLAEYTVRTFSLQMEGSKEERIVKQYHYTVWPDHGVPEYPTSLLQFVRKVMVCNPLNAGPIVVHCRWVGEGGGEDREREGEEEGE